MIGVCSRDRTRSRDRAKRSGQELAVLGSLARDGGLPLARGLPAQDRSPGPGRDPPAVSSRARPARRSAFPSRPAAGDLDPRCRRRARSRSSVPGSPGVDVELVPVDPLAERVRRAARPARRRGAGPDRCRRRRSARRGLRRGPLRRRLLPERARPLRGSARRPRADDPASSSRATGWSSSTPLDEAETEDYSQLHDWNFNLDERSLRDLEPRAERIYPDEQPAARRAVRVRLRRRGRLPVGAGRDSQARLSRPARHPRRITSNRTRPSRDRPARPRARSGSASTCRS